MKIKTPIFLDYHSTTPIDERVFDEMKPYFTVDFGNASSKSHVFGWKAEAAVQLARKRISSMIHSSPEEIIFTSGATESINLALKGIAEYSSKNTKRIITTQTEHKATLDTCKRLEESGCEIIYLNVDKYGMIDLNELKNSIDNNTILVSIMFANNEIGTIHPVQEIGNICKEHGVLFHTDAAQAAGKIKIDVDKMNIDLMSFSAHKMYGPKGIGALYIRKKNPRINLLPQIDGGGHERGFRSGTLNVPAIVGFGKACDIAVIEMAQDDVRMKSLRDKLFNMIKEECEGVYLNGHPENRLSNNLNIRFEYTDADTLMMAMKDIAISSGSACSSYQPEPSHVLKAIGLNERELRESVRIGLGKLTTETEILYVAERITSEVKKIRQHNLDMSLK